MRRRGGRSAAITVPEAPWAAPERLRLLADGTFEYRLTQAVVAPGGGGLGRDTPPSRRGTYTFQKPELTLLHAHGKRERKALVYAPEQNTATMKGESWYGEALSAGPLRCDD